MKVRDLEGAHLDYCVAVARRGDADDIIWSRTYERYFYVVNTAEPGTVAHLEMPKFSTDWEAGGLLIELFHIRLEPTKLNWAAWEWTAWIKVDEGDVDYAEVDAVDAVGRGKTPLVAAMRAFVASRLGDEVSLPSS